MSHTIKRFLIITFLISGFGLMLFAQKNVVHPFALPSAREAGMGGLHITNTDGTGALLHNPAGLVGKEEWGLADFTFSIMAPFDKMGDFTRYAPKLIGVSDDDGSKSEKVNDIRKLYKNITGKDDNLNAGVGIAGPISLSVIGKGFGFGVFSGAAMDTVFDNQTINVLADVGAQANFAYGFRILEKGSHILDAGIGIHAFFRIGIEKKFTFNDLAQIDEVKFPVNSTLGIGLDLGVQYQYGEKLKVAIAANNLFSFAQITDVRDRFDMLKDGEEVNESVDGSIKRGLNLGASYDLLNGDILDLTLMADYRGILDLFSKTPRNPLLNIGIGAELGLFNHIFVRAGLADALPSLGLGFDLFACKINVAAYGKELGFDPGDYRVLNIDLSVLFRW